MIRFSSINILLKAKKLIRMASRSDLLPLLRYGISPSLEHDYVLKTYASECHYIVDVGANIGQFLMASYLTNQSIPIFSFEPHHKSYLLLSRVAALHEYSHTFQNGLSDADQLLPFNVLSSLDSSSFLSPSTLQLKSFNQKVIHSSERLRVSRLDSFISTINPRGCHGFLKIDVQGFELKVLQGAITLLSSYIKYIYVELSLDVFYEDQPLAYATINFLCKYDFSLVGIHNPHFGKCGQMLQADFLFERKLSEL
jgi:FkbM family methyltransferase